MWPRTWHRFRISLDLCPSGLPESVGEWNKLLCWACRPVVLATCEEDYEFDASIRCTVDSVSKNKNNKIGCIKFLGSVIYNAKEGDEEMVQWLRALTALLEGLGLSPLPSS